MQSGLIFCPFTSRRFHRRPQEWVSAMPRLPIRFIRVVLRLERLEDRATPAALTPAQVRHAYGFDQIAGDGTGQTIAIIDAYNDPYIVSDLDTFDQQYGATATSPTLYDQYGAASTFLTVATPQGRPSNNSGWGGEMALDVEWAHAIAPGAKILLVEALSSSTLNLQNAIQYATQQSGVVAVSMSWGGSETASETSSGTEGIFASRNGLGITFVAAAGDNAGQVLWPAVSPHVVAVGGTHLTLDANGNWAGETAWSGGGGGASLYFIKPIYQTAYVGSRRGVPDVAYDADPGTGVSVYNTYDGGWEQVGGTSAGAPQWAALVAVADQVRATQLGLGSLDGFSQTLPKLYAMRAGNFHDVTSGSNGNPALPGYDLVTGRGSPVANLVINALAATATSGVGGGLEPGGTTIALGKGRGGIGFDAVVAPNGPAAANGLPAPAADLGTGAPTGAPLLRPDAAVVAATPAADRRAGGPVLQPADDAPWWSRGAGANRVARGAPAAPADAGQSADPDDDDWPVVDGA
jgi:subtilase family serine protease